MARPLPENVREAVKLLFFQHVCIPAISRQTGVKPNTIAGMALRQGWRRLRSEKDTTPGHAVIKVGVRSVSRDAIALTESSASSALRESFAATLARHAEVLEKVPAASSIKAIREVGEALEPLVRSAKIVHGWGQETLGGLVLAEMLSDERAERPASALAQGAVDVAASVQPQAVVGDPVSVTDTNGRLSESTPTPASPGSPEPAPSGSQTEPVQGVSPGT